MKTRILVLLAAGSLSLSAIIPGTKHDLSTTGPGAKSNTTQTCVFCHTPHGSATGGIYVADQINGRIQKFQYLPEEKEAPASPPKPQ